MSIKDNLKQYRKKLVTYALISGIGLSSLTACDKIKYKTNENEIVEINGEIDIDEVRNFKFIHLINDKIKRDRYYLVKEEITICRSGNIVEYRNIENGMIIYNSDDYKNFRVDVIIDDNMIDYLFKYDMIQDTYINKDITKLKENLMSDSDFNIKKSENKQFIK